MRNDKEPLQVAVIGLGKMGLLHASILSILPNVNLVGICETSKLMRRIAKKALKGVLVAESLDAFSDLDLDAVYITTPIPLHYDHIKQVYEKNLARNVFVEKTLSSSRIKSEELVNLSLGLRSINMVGYMKRFGVTFLKAKELVDQGVLGEQLSFEAYAFSSDFAGVNTASTSISRGGVLFDLGAHVVDLAIWLFGDMDVTSASIKSLTGPGAMDSVDFRVKNVNEVTGSFSVSWVKEGYRMPEFGLTIKGTKGTVTVDDSRVKLIIPNSPLKEWYRHNLSEAVPFLLAEPEYFREDDIFIKSVRSRTEVQPNFQTSLKVDKLLEEVVRKANEQ
jgi:predicted dehydrogenase